MDVIIEFSELASFIEQPIRMYSSGMLARLGFSVIANLEPDILLIDEILAVGDKDFQKKCLEKMQEFKKLGVTIVLVSHNMGDVEMMCDRAIWIEDHYQKMDGHPSEVIQNYLNPETS
jgi:lipopolysaccharide transport system ATP-binding protein